MHLRDLTRYLQELSENNNRPWFIMNKPRYDILREEFLELVTQVIVEVGKFDPAVKFCNPKKAMFRINRDVRFAHDKSPYKTNFSAALAPNDMRRPTMAGGPTYYFQLNKEGMLHFGAGEYIPPPHRLRALRKHMVEDAAGFRKVLNNKALKARYGTIQNEGKLQRPPKGFDAEHEHIEFIKLKSFFIWTEVKVELNKPELLLPQIAAGLKDSLPLVTWMRQAKTEEEEA
ncbi:DUF2461 domain-containing protein [Massilia sp. MB5]|uniref:DUF2461 domain-containing protein n=1 Tax=unclassified Massilia TaxID=2609279 RepID=UPI00067CAA28|nr:MULTISPECIES: DUF2461 domain-containing protein [unclassified Massilia]AKU23019.1 hypothetical protein ACZ75_17710 [Massilia sp. NR 4-1]UMR32117.1 DUF2461 domain-containing protein [Massilia sp. MB5]